MKRILAAVALVSAAILGSGGTAGAATGNQTFIINGGESNTGTLFAVGPVTGVGLDIESETSETSVFQFDDGSFNVSHPATSDDFTFNPTTCVGRDRFTGTYSLSGGTGAYAGISGSGTYRGWAIFVAERNPDGSCSEDEAVFSGFFVRATGTTTRP